MQQGFDKLLKKYSVKADARLSLDGKELILDGKTIPVLPWESERRFTELRNLVVLGRVGKYLLHGRINRKFEDSYLAGK